VKERGGERGVRTHHDAKDCRDVALATADLDWPPCAGGRRSSLFEEDGAIPGRSRNPIWPHNKATNERLEEAD
jgi:hypothetical protein